MSGKKFSDDQNAAFVARLSETATVGELSDVLEVLGDALMATARYMVADYRLPNEDDKRKAIDGMLEMLQKIQKLQRTLTKMPSDGAGVK